MPNLLTNIVAALVFAFIGIVVFVLSFIIIDRLTPYDLWKEIVEEKNMALAMLVGAMSHRHLHHHRGRGSLTLVVRHVSRAASSILLIAACGLIYELIAGTLASYLLGDSVFAVLDGHRHLSVRDGHRQLPVALHRARPGRAVHLDRAADRPGRRLLVGRAVPRVRVHAGLPAAALR